MLNNIYLFLLNFKMSNNNSFIHNRSIFVVILCFVFSFNTKAQINDIIGHSNQSYKKYKIEFEIKDEIKIDLKLLSYINFDKYVYLRKPSERVEVVDDITGMTIIIYSEEELKIVKEPYFNFVDYPDNVSNKVQ